MTTHNEEALFPGVFWDEEGLGWIRPSVLAEMQGGSIRRASRALHFSVSEGWMLRQQRAHPVHGKIVAYFRPKGNTIPHDLGWAVTLAKRSGWHEDES